MRQHNRPDHRHEEQQRHHLERQHVLREQQPPNLGRAAEQRFRRRFQVDHDIGKRVICLTFFGENP